MQRLRYSTQGISHFILLCIGTNSIRQSALRQIIYCTQSLVVAPGASLPLTVPPFRKRVG